MKKVGKVLSVLPLVLLGGICMGCSGKSEPIPEYEGYSLVWNDEFNGKTLNTEDWNYEYHEPGWVNNELQEYVDSKENVYLSKGQLVIQPLKAMKADHTMGYTSGRVNLQNKHAIKYGRIDVKAKVPQGKGFLPAIWMMANDENFYGQWPKCGEIDIMEVLGHDTKTLYSTIHYGEPHAEGQGTYTLKEGSFADEFHVFSCEWEPGELRFYVDGILYNTQKEWYSKKPGFEEVTYPAPFDQPFYLILNVAVGGNWPGNPDSTTEFNQKAAMYVDYVRLYQKEAYDENVTKAAKVVNYREPDATGNYIENPNFEPEKLNDNKAWRFLKAGKGVGSAEIANNTLIINTEDSGDLEYSIQVIQSEIPMVKGSEYKISFDMKASEPRKARVAITAPEAGWVRYFPDTTFDVGTSMKHYEYTFLMDQPSDPHGRFEFNLGALGSTAQIVATNIRVEKTGEGSLVQGAECLPDGNYVVNGSFDTGATRLAHWETESSVAGTVFEATNENLVRQFRCTVPSAPNSLSDVKLVQNDITLGAQTEYVLSFTASSDKSAKIQASYGEFNFNAALSAEEKQYEYHFTTGKNTEPQSLVFYIGNQGTTVIDNVSLREDGLLVNGNFNSGMTGYEVYAYTTNDVSYTVDSLNEDSAFSIDVMNTGDQDWHIQLKQNNITLENGTKYKLAFDAKCTMDREIMYALQRDGSSDDNWIPYSGTQHINLGTGFKHYECTFTMDNPTDERTILSISMGAVSGTKITKKHTVVIDNIVLEKVE